MSSAGIQPVNFMFPSFQARCSWLSLSKQFLALANVTPLSSNFLATSLYAIAGCNHGFLFNAAVQNDENKAAT